MVQQWAKMLKEMPESRSCVLDLVDIEEKCARCHDAYLDALRGDPAPLTSFIKSVALGEVRRGVEVGKVLRALWMFRSVATAHHWSEERLFQLDGVICHAAGIFADLCEGLRSESGYLSMLEALATALEAKDEYTSSHCQTVQRISEVIADDLGVEIGPTGLFHDLGKMHVPDHILRKPGKLTAAEYDVVKQHSLHAYRMLALLPPPLPALVLQHHERPDGLGYPLGRTEVPMASAVVAVADTLHAIVSDRPYRSAQPFDYAVEVINEVKGTQLRDEPVEAFNRVKEVLREIEVAAN